MAARLSCAALLSLLAWLVAWPAMAAGPSEVVAPFKLIAGHVVVQVKLDGAPVQAVLDTGAPHSVIDATYAGAHGIAPPKLLSKLLPDNGRLKVNGTKVDTAVADYELGGIKSNDFFFLADLKGLGSPMVVGAPLFEKWVVELDFDRQLMTLHPRSGFKPPAQATRLEIKAQQEHYFIPASIEGAKAELAQLDLGNSSEVLINKAYADQLSLRDGRTSSARRYSGINVNGSADRISLSSLDLAGFKFQDMPASLLPEDDKVFGRNKLNIGLGVMSRFHLWLDLHGRQIWLIPGANFGKPFSRWVIGVNWVDDPGGLRIVNLQPDGAAMRAGLKVGDVLASVDGVEDRGQISTFIAVSEGRNMDLHLSDGRVVRLAAERE